MPGTSNHSVRFLFSLLTVFALTFGGTWYWMMGHYMNFLNVDYPVWKAKDDMLNRCDVGLLVVIGDSRAGGGIAPNQIGAGTVNLALSLGTTFEALTISKRILACPVPPKAVILSLAFDNFLGSEPVWDRTIKLGTLGVTAEDLDSLRQRARRYGDTEAFGTATPFDIDARLKTYLCATKFPSYYIADLLWTNIHADWDARIKENQRIYAAIMGERGQYTYSTANGYWGIDPSTEAEHFFVSPYQASLVDSIIELYEAHHIPIYYLSPPYKANDMKALNPTVRWEFEAFLKSYTQRYPGFHVIGDVFQSLPNEDFGDIVHVNRMGTTEWSKNVAQLLTANHIEH